jgi:hypothetical protein
MMMELLFIEQEMAGKRKSGLLRVLENTELPFILFSYCKEGGAAYENIDFGSEWDFNRTGRLGFTFG